jgi:hypothetical protein
MKQSVGLGHTQNTILLVTSHVYAHAHTHTHTHTHTIDLKDGGKTCFFCYKYHV